MKRQRFPIRRTKRQRNKATKAHPQTMLRRSVGPGRSRNRTERRSGAERGSQQERAANAENGNGRMR
jgi:hypothetical protein